jgi:RNA polymerase sigma-70 factor (ECF subfamily)
MLTALSRQDVAFVESAREHFEGLLRGSYRQAYNLAYRLTGNGAEAEDLVQETFLRAFRFFHRYNEDLPFANWLYRIMCNAHIDSVRRRKRIKTMSLEQPVGNGSSTWEIPDPDASPDRDLLDSTMDEHVQSSLLEMNAEFRTAVLLADVEGLAYEEVAAIMGTSVGTVRSRIHRGRKQLRKMLLRRCPQLYGGSTIELH